MKFLIKNSNVVFSNCVKKKDILIENKKISKIEDCLEDKDSFLIDASSLFCMPGIFDVHVHLRDPGFLEKETVKTGAKAAAKGGVTSLFCMPNTKPVMDSEENIGILKKKIEKEKINIYIVAAITKNLEGKELVDFEKLKSFGVVGFSDDGLPLENSYLLKTALEKAKKLSLSILAHCEDKTLSKQEIIGNENECISLAKHIGVSLATNCPIHICHVSTKESVLLIEAAKKIGVKITAETAPHYFMLTKEDIKKQDPNFKMNPPLRSKEDREAIEKAILNKTIDCIATDHAPHEEESKKDFKTASNGVIGLETLLPCTLTNFYHTKKLSLPSISNLLSKNPAEIFKFEDKGEIKKGAIADLILVDVNKIWNVKKSDFVSKSKNSPFIGKTLKGQVIKTFCKGELIFSLF